MFTSALLITADIAQGGAPVLSGHVLLDSGHGAVERAVLRYSALGVVEARMNGVPVSDALLTPGWSSYEWRIRVAETDVTPLMEPRTELELEIGNGWYRGGLTWAATTNVYGNELAGIAELEISYEDGHLQRWGTDQTWTARPSDTVSDDLYNGQTIDARRRDIEWERQPVRIVEDSAKMFEPYIGPPVTPREELGIIDAWTTPSGRIIADFGRNIVGWVRCRAAGVRGQTVTLRHAEVVERGELSTRPLRSAEATDRFILSGGEDVFEPSFTFHGFRYVEVEGWPGGIDELIGGGLTALSISSDLRRTGTFSSSEPLLNQLHDNVVASTVGNFVDLPTDCPQRDERLGWTGDIAVFAPTSTFLFDSSDFLRDWLRDVTLEQEHQGGVVPYVVPDVLKYVGAPADITPVDSTAVWSDAIVWVPWAVWMSSGDDAVLRENFPAMLSHLRHVEGLLSPSGLWDQGFQFGDWLDPDSPPEDPAAAKADKTLVAMASLHRSAALTAETARVLGFSSEQAEMERLREDTRKTFRAAFVDDDAERLRNHCETAYALAIAFDLLDLDEIGWAGSRLAELVEANGYRISTGFAGTPYILTALSRSGQLATAGRLLLQTECPSWLYPVTMGATTVWERWDSMLPDGSINPGEMTSFNHYALGAVADWMHRDLVGLAPAEPGYRRVIVAPKPIAGVEWAKAEYDSPHGRIAVGWNRDGDSIVVDITLPPGVTADVSVGDLDVRVAAGVHHLSANLNGHAATSREGSRIATPG
ncbi:family 78 glycoside hydrolase catalytic domain [Agreia sp. Leaf283]|uniref:family 78 glycoside hydrolase catalytic domain n=1 Tax=Agreia sp. Leaf283 TaxID=1736321 RepID=UPI0007000C5A|nr:family 78 glycoside hydrolase catalytic domain [Agreia sp. Leaf283]KQP54724.1 alpha-L-rhamnosidase [Agreia sp. Leaf283]